LTELAYERALLDWMKARSMASVALRYPGASGGEVLAYRLKPAVPPRGVVILVHGAGNDALYSFPGLIKQFLSRGYQLFTFDLDGHGRGSTTVLDPATLGRAVPAAARRARISGSDLPVHLVGISLGGALALHAAALAPDAFASAALVAAPLQVRLTRRAMLRELGPRSFRTLWRERAHCGLWGLVPAFGPVKRSVYPLRLGVPPGRGPFGYVDVLNDALERLRLRECARSVSAPVLLAYGEADAIVPIEQAEELARLIPFNRLLRLPRDTHLTAPLAPATARAVLDWVEAYAHHAA
jgi:pimeloyl-ACP methyl ester carboxylesterase